jgi:hypothetical protein
LIDSAQFGGRIFGEMVSRAGLHPNRINMNTLTPEVSLIKMALEAVGPNQVVYDELMQFFTVSSIAESRCSLIS